MIEESKRLEYWNFLISEKNQPRPKGITIHRLAVIKAALLRHADLWNRVIEGYAAASLPAAEFYESGDSYAVRSRADFWEAVRSTIVRDENRKSIPPAPKNNSKYTGSKNRRTRMKR